MSARMLLLAIVSTLFLETIASAMEPAFAQPVLQPFVARQEPVKEETIVWIPSPTKPMGATPEVICRHHEKLDQMASAKRSVQRRLVSDGVATPPNLARRLRLDENKPLDGTGKAPQTYTV